MKTAHTSVKQHCLQVEDIRLTYGQWLVLDHLSLDIVTGPLQRCLAQTAPGNQRS
ncbi:hypothetical protein [Ktedonosporobacter rubrisoli]|uniref:hypothetical protein n=1 Tax=Ktedonosporobacter rubrisoli TaxID=2509675 RepID=UPI001F5DA21F|nr:hypothetical protein [Ktedonosporobacter rubrisoli]